MTFKIDDIVDVEYPQAPVWNGRGKVVKAPDEYDTRYAVKFFDRTENTKGSFGARHLTLAKPVFKVGDKVSFTTTGVVEKTGTRSGKLSVKVNDEWRGADDFTLVREAAPTDPGSVVEIDGMRYFRAGSEWIDTRGVFATNKENNDSDFIVKEIS